MEYLDFIASKQIRAADVGYDIALTDINKSAFEWQKLLIRWSLMKGRCANFQECGLGKTIQQLCFADETRKHTGMPALILAPLAVSAQTKLQGEAFGIEVNICETQRDVTKNAVNITNYEKLHCFDCSSFGSVALDESSILKNNIGKIRNQLIENFKNTPFKSCYSATPAPNDFMELGNHSEFLGVMSYFEMLATFFVHDGGDTSKWRLKGHAEDAFWDWIASWACIVPNPSILGYYDERYDLPPLNVQQITVKSEMQDDSGQLLLFPSSTQTLQQRAKARKDSLQDRVKKACEIANSNDEQYLVWCDYNAESELLAKNIRGAVEVTGSDSDAKKISAMLGFASGDVRVLVSKPSICGYGMNWQNCSNEIFVGLSDSFEKYYQALRRCWRFGQDKTVNAYIVVSEAEGAVKDNIERKQRQAQEFMSKLAERTKSSLLAEINKTSSMTTSYVPTERMILPL
ncbi:MAG: helicase [Lachnospiraceae bacterium]|nr:helicase [Lachnospiraceae bacterium]